MSKKLIITIAVAGLISFAGAFAFAWFTKTTPQSQPTETEQQVVTDREAELRPPPVTMAASSTVGPVGTNKIGVIKKHLENLIYDVRQKTQEYNNKLHAHELKEQRLQITQNALEKDTEEFNNLRLELASIVARLKEQRNKLEGSRVKIAKAERDNLISIAATYDKMDAASACKILTNMSQGSSFDDAVKILHFMTERTRAKLLAELAVSDPKLAWSFCQRLKLITRED